MDVNDVKLTDDQHWTIFRESRKPKEKWFSRLGKYKTETCEMPQCQNPAFAVCEGKLSYLWLPFFPKIW